MKFDLEFLDYQYIKTTTNMTQEELKKRTKKFTIDVILHLRKFDKSIENEVVKKQLIKSASSVGANYRACCRAKSKADFINKIKIVEEEADESLFWLEVMSEIQGNKFGHDKLMDEAKELTAIFTATGKTLRNN